MNPSPSPYLNLLNSPFFFCGAITIRGVVDGLRRRRCVRQKISPSLFLFPSTSFYKLTSQKESFHKLLHTNDAVRRRFTNLRIPNWPSLPVIVLMLKICGFATLLVLQESAEAFAFKIEGFSILHFCDVLLANINLSGSFRTFISIFITWRNIRVRSCRNVFQCINGITVPGREGSEQKGQAPKASNIKDGVGFHIGVDLLTLRSGSGKTLRGRLQFFISYVYLHLFS